MMVASYEGGSVYSNEESSDYLTYDDLTAVRRQVPGITASSPMIELHDRIAVPGGKERDVLVLGLLPVHVVRNWMSWPDAFSMTTTPSRATR